MKKLEEMSVDELKIAIFDAENQVKAINNQVRAAYQVLSSKLQKNGVANAEVVEDEGTSRCNKKRV